MCIWLDRIIIHIITRTHTWTTAFALDFILDLKSLNTIQSIPLRAMLYLLPTLHCSHTVPNAHHIPFYTSNLWTTLTFYVGSTSPDMWDVTSLFKASNGKRQNLDIIKLCHIIFTCSKLKILLLLQDKLYSFSILCRWPNSMNSYLVKSFQIRISENQISYNPEKHELYSSLWGFGFYAHKHFKWLNTDMEREQKGMKVVPLLLFIRLP